MGTGNDSLWVTVGIAVGLTVAVVLMQIMAIGDVHDCRTPLPTSTVAASEPEFVPYVGATPFPSELTYSKWLGQE